MLTNIGLSPTEIQEVTGFRRSTKQCEALASMNIPFKVRPNGTPFVAQIDVADAKYKIPLRPPEAVIKLI